MAERQLPLPGELVRKSNALARARWQPVSIWEPRIVALIASKVHADDEDFQTYKIPIAELVGITDKNLSGFQYLEIRKAIQHIGKSTVLISGKNNRDFRQYNFFSMCGYEHGCLVARFDPDLKPHFLNLKMKFTEFSLVQYLTLPSIYSQRLFEFLKSWSNCKEGEITISVAELHELLDTPESFKNDFRLFRTRVLDKGHKDITAKTSLRYEWEAIKKGRSYLEVHFIFSYKIEALLEAKKIADMKTIVNTNNKIFKKAVSCAEKKNGKCAKQDNTKRTCEVCVSNYMCESVLKKINT
jgi:plasmid replication initiation protein